MLNIKWQNQSPGQRCKNREDLVRRDQDFIMHSQLNDNLVKCDNYSLCWVILRCFIV